MKYYYLVEAWGYKEPKDTKMSWVWMAEFRNGEHAKHDSYQLICKTRITKEEAGI